MALSSEYLAAMVAHRDTSWRGAARRMHALAVDRAGNRQGSRGSGRDRQWTSATSPRLYINWWLRPCMWLLRLRYGNTVSCS